MPECPRCSDPISAKAVVCNGCGWTPAGVSVPADPLRFLCSHEDRGQRCGAPASLAQSTAGKGPWFCHVHFPAFRGVAGGSGPLGGFRSLREFLPSGDD